ncbi:MAG: tetratricopeptide repeat protein [bacterium]|nr:tetratricopeptide repeat protein [bacterium]
MPRFVKISALVSALFLSAIANNLAAQDSNEEISKANEALLSGDYGEARSLYRPFVESAQDGQVREDAMGYFKTYNYVGDYSEGLKEVEKFIENKNNDPYLLNIKGKFYEKLGNFTEAEKFYKQSRVLKNDYWENQIDLARLYEKTGRRTQAYGIYTWIYNEYQNNSFRTSKLLTFAGISASKMGEFHVANTIFNTANKLNDKDVDNLYQWAELFRQKFNNAEADRAYEEAIQINPHRSEFWVGLAKSSQSLTRMEYLAGMALGENPNDVDAMSVLAELNIIDGKFEEARSEVDNALTLNPSHIIAMAHRASIYYLTDDMDKFAQTEREASRINKYCSEFYVTVGENLVKRFMYEDAVDMGYEAVARDRTDTKALSLLGNNLLRLGRIREAYNYINLGFSRDEFNLFAANTLNLLDSFRDFETIGSENFTLMIHKSESSVLADNILKYAEECLDSLSNRYAYRPQGKIILEAYNDKDDFAVRVSGLPGAPLLGVCFGDLIAITTPAAHEGNNYNWARTLWHEMGHVMAMGMSAHRVPRWYTEGLSVYEEKKARPRWARDMDLELFYALDKDLLLPINKFNEGFTRPKFIAQIGLSYYQASKVIEFLDINYSWKAVTDILLEFRQNHDVNTSFVNVLNKTADQINEEFFDYLKIEKEKIKDVIEGLPDLLGYDIENESYFEKLLGKQENKFLKILKEGWEELESGDINGAEEKFREALDIYPAFIQRGNPYAGLAEVYRRQENEQQLEETLRAYLQVTEYGAEESLELAQILLNKNNTKDAEMYLKKSFEVDPFEASAHKILAELYENRQQYNEAVSERRILVALDPLDKARAYYELALTLFNNKQYTDAKKEVLKSLELAPGFREAQKLLLKIASSQDK